MCEAKERAWAKIVSAMKEYAEVYGHIVIEDFDEYGKITRYLDTANDVGYSLANVGKIIL